MRLVNHGRLFCQIVFLGVHDHLKRTIAVPGLAARPVNGDDRPLQFLPPSN